LFEDVDWNLVFLGLGALFAFLLFIVNAYQAYHACMHDKVHALTLNQKRNRKKVKV